VPDTGPARPEFRSRGLLVTDLCDALHASEVGERLAETDLARYRPFSLLAVDPNARARLFEWTGYALEEDAHALARLPLASSSFDQSIARVQRRQLFEDLLAATGGKLTAALQSAFHHSHAGGPGPFSVCMHRTDAETRSFTRVSVRAGEVEMVYRAGAPCSVVADTRFLLPRHRTVAAGR
jgi:hypothetical protein